MENQTVLTTTYGEFRDTLKDELQKSAEGFVKIGYLLKVARDTDILKDSNYESVNDFANGEYGLTKDQVSRFIAINERFSEGGDSERLETKYAAFGYAKLTEILTLPDAVIEVLSPELTRREIQEVKKEIKEEEKISDVEVLLEGQKTEQQEMNNLQKVFHQYFHEERQQYLKLAAVIKGVFEVEAAVDEILNAVAPSGIAVKTVRIQGIGRLMLSFKGKDNKVELLNTRNNEKQEFSWNEVVENLQITFGHDASKTYWSKLYGEPFDVPQLEPKVAPVQQNGTVEKPQKDEIREEKKTTPKENTGNETEEKLQIARKPVLKGLMNDPYCPECGEALPEYQEKCECGQKIDWSYYDQLEKEPKQEEPNVVEKAECEDVSEEEQLPGQMNVGDYPELAPDSKNTEAQQDPEVLTGSVENTGGQISDETIESWLRVETQDLMKEVSENNWMSAISISQLITEFLQKIMKERIEGVENE